MKYKNINSMLHNFAHSFLSLMNYVDNRYAIDVIIEHLNTAAEEKVTISFPSGDIEPEMRRSKNSKALKKAIGYYVEWLPKHATSHDVEIGKLKDIRIVASRTSGGYRYVIQARDDRDKEYEILIKDVLASPTK